VSLPQPPELDPAVAHRVRPARGAPRGALVLLHGRGADERDLEPLLDELDPDRRLVGVTLRGPHVLPGSRGAHWYAVPRVGEPDPETYLRTLGEVGPWLGALPEALGLRPDQVALGGFSQGAVMAYALGLVAGRPTPAGIVALSGFLPEVPGAPLDLAGRAGLAVAIGHGTHDPVIPVDLARAARERLRDAGLSVTYRETPMFHGIDPVFVHVLRNWLLDRLP
jgi:phospholipase/carboxylesterase